MVQLSMNMNTGIYANGVKGIAAEYGISQQAARVGQAVFLIAYAFGSELWAPWSEELGRRPIMQISLFLVNVFQLPCALAPNYGSIVVGRVLGGLSSAGGSVTLGMVADMWEPEEQEWPLAYVVFSSVGGSSIGPIVGPFVEAYLSWRWIFWVQLIFGGEQPAILATRAAADTPMQAWCSSSTSSSCPRRARPSCLTARRSASARRARTCGAPTRSRRSASRSRASSPPGTVP
jgi:MFS family permease